MLRSTLAALALIAPTAMSAQTADIVATAQSAGSFETLIDAIQAAGLEDTLSDGGPFTIFAPTDAAFEGLPDGAVEELLDPANRDELVALLTYHVVPGQLESFDFSGTTVAVATVNGSPLSVDGTAGVMVDDAEVVEADILATNGVIHVIDRVLVPMGP